MENISATLSPSRPNVEGKYGRTIFWPDILMGLYAAGWVVTVPFVGQAYASEFLALVCLPFIKSSVPLRKFRSLPWIVVGYGLLALFLVISDLVNKTATVDTLRGLATPLFGAVELLFVVTVLNRKPTAVVTFCVVTALAKGILGEAGYKGAFSEVGFDIQAIQTVTNYFKVRFVPFLLPALIGASYFLCARSYLSAAIIFIFSAGLFFATDARSAGLALFFSGILLLSKVYRFRPSLIQVFGFLIVVIPLFLFSYRTYVDYILQSNPFGQGAAQLSKMEDPYNPLELLLQGRSEWTVFAEAEKERPLFGYGSWAKDIDNRFEILRATRTHDETNAVLTEAQTEGLIPVHSVIGTSIIWAGLGGGLGATIILLFFVKEFAAVQNANSRLLPISQVYGVLAIWDCIFSPMQVLRLSLPVSIAIVLILAKGARRNSALTPRRRPV